MNKIKNWLSTHILNWPGILCAIECIALSFLLFFGIYQAQYDKVVEYSTNLEQLNIQKDVYNDELIGIINQYESILEHVPTELKADFIGITDSRQVQRFTSPLPEKYMSNITSSQALRAAMSGTSTGGQDTADVLHNAIDIACPERTSVYASKAGVVIENWPSYYNGGIWTGHKTYGGMIILEHFDGTRTLYAHLSRTDVKEGEVVQRGEQIGLSGGITGKRGSGVSTGPHLHYSIILDIKEFLIE